jgi:hypothetical protein
MTQTLSASENLLFQLTRWLALMLIFVLLLAIAAFTIFYLRPPGESVSVTYADVERVLTPQGSTAQPTEALPENVPRGLAGNEKVMEGWLDVLRVEERPQFIRMMSAVIAEAEAKKATDVVAVVNKFKELCFDRRGSTAFEPYATAAKRAVLVGQVLLMAGLVGMFIVILVLLAIERHLRPLHRAV